ncbi:bacillithiol biosynthesis deacetylase BshB1 [Paenibacillus psychroresistens]|uniref:Bacillithiol biosynthesis deacetylase BshB1 n=1 Tax=Paenibacillus psychroresistens TaxID=1778678 RepID=A0A6B8RM64_9BACL|nr:bacillithiol biosynthesis deacetylase BshB1 [Paenibacillus psychroresistens]QGQ96844.1 bacillithiol biosynthesis deacetylase BshB1 [Paenibacillus psychroresistens]
MTQQLDILIFGAHPDDAEIGMGATIYKHTNAGYRVGICDLTYAEMSSNGNKESRMQEAEAAAQILGLAARTNLGLPDRGLFVCQEQIEAIVLEIRKFKPRLVFAPYWEDRHPDHILCSQLVQQAVFNAKLPKYLPETPATTVEQLYFYFINDVHATDLMVDVTEFYPHKLDALRAYRTQFLAAPSGEEYIQTPINQGFLQAIEARDRLLGQKRQISFAEGFVTKQPHVVNLF